MARGGQRENAGRNKKSEEEKKKFLRKTIIFSTEEDMILLEKIEKYGTEKSFSASVKELIANEIKKRES